MEERGKKKKDVIWVKKRWVFQLKYKQFTTCIISSKAEYAFLPFVAF
jgi:hypothetical protein